MLARLKRFCSPPSRSKGDPQILRLLGPAAGLQFRCNPLFRKSPKRPRFTAKPFKLHGKQQTLNHRVPGSSPGAPTTQPLQTARFRYDPK